MSKAVSSVFGSGKTGKYGYENQISDYLNNYNTSNTDNTLSNLSSYANTASQNLADTLGNYSFNVNASDEARQRAEDATYQLYVDKLTPQFQRQNDDLATRLANQGLSVGSEAYQRAMNDLSDNQNEALNQAAQQSVLNGQNAYSQSLNDQINASTFGNNAQSAYIQQLITALQGSPSGYEHEMNKYSIKSGIQNRQNTAASSGWSNLGSAIGAGMNVLWSDERLKENIVPVGKLNNSLTVYRFNYIHDTTPQIGLIAQEVQKVKPEAVIENDGYLMVDYEKATEE